MAGKVGSGAGRSMLVSPIFGQLDEHKHNRTGAFCIVRVAVFDCVVQVFHRSAPSALSHESNSVRPSRPRHVMSCQSVPAPGER